MSSIDSLPGLLDSWAGSQPDTTAVWSRHGSLTYRELDEQVSAFASGLMDLGVGPGSVVGLMCTNRPEWIVAALATVRLGGRVAAFNTWAKKWDLCHLLAESGCEVLIGLSRFRETDIEAMLRDLVPEAWDARSTGWQAESYGNLREIVLIDALEQTAGVRSFADVLAAAGSGASLEPITGPAGSTGCDEPILVFYTSGSTNRPKAVPIHHRIAVEHARDVAARMGVVSGDALWMPVPLFWSYGGANALMVALVTGATAVLQEAFEPAEALQIIEDRQCTVAYTLPNITVALVSHPDFTRDRVRTMVKGITIGSPEEVETAAIVLGVTDICNSYGSTELYGGCCVTPSDWPLERKLGSQGPPLPRNTLVVRDLVTRKPLPAGKTGEIIVRGQVTPGYLGSPEQTRASFSADGEFRTGDLGYVDESGDLHFVGRASEMIRTGGINIAPAEVEEFLRTHPAVAEAAVVGLPDDAKGEVAVAYVTLADPASPVQESDLRAYCRDRIASYKVPVRFVVTADSLPRTDTGKLSRAAVRGMAANFMAGARSPVPGLPRATGSE